MSMNVKMKDERRTRRRVVWVRGEEFKSIPLPTFYDNSQGMHLSTRD